MINAIVIAAGALAVGGMLSWYLLASPGSQVLCPTIPSGSRKKNLIALTFDDGPGPETGMILDILRTANVRATFFVCGVNAAAHSELLRRIADDGHCIGNHAFSHKHFLGKSTGWMKQEIVSTQDMLNSILGDRMDSSSASTISVFRPPYGLRWFGLAAVLKDLNLHAVMWDTNPEDWKRDPEEIINGVAGSTRNGSIILLHDGVPPKETTSRRNTVEALPEIIRRLSGRFEFTTIPELIRASNN